MAKKRIRFDYERATLEELRAYRTRLFESDRKLFGKTPRARYQEVTERFRLPQTLGVSFMDPELERREIRKQISIMTGGYEYHVAKTARESLGKMLERLGASDAMIEYSKTLSLSDIQYHSEEYNYLFRILQGYQVSLAQDEGDAEPILGDIADTFIEIERKRHGGKLTEKEIIELLGEWEV